MIRVHSNIRQEFSIYSFLEERLIKPDTSGYAPATVWSHSWGDYSTKLGRFFICLGNIWELQIWQDIGLHAQMCCGNTHGSLTGQLSLLTVSGRNRVLLPTRLPFVCKKKFISTQWSFKFKSSRKTGADPEVLFLTLTLIMYANTYINNVWGGGLALS